jgi:hypothetical protein
MQDATFGRGDALRRLPLAKKSPTPKPWFGTPSFHLKRKGKGKRRGKRRGKRKGKRKGRKNGRRENKEKKKKRMTLN